MQTLAPRWRALVAPTIATLVALAILVSLGFWQIGRKAWKEDLTAQIQSRAFGEAGEIVPEARWGAWRAADDEFRKVQVTGTFLHDRETLVHGLMSAQRGQPVQGYYVLTPLRLADGSHVIINRGFIPSELRDKTKRAESSPDGSTTVTGLVRAPENPGTFIPDNRPREEEWFTRSVAEIAQARGLERVAPFLIDADATPNPGGWPRGGQTPVKLRNEHLQYALTWFGIALTLLAVYGSWVWRRLRVHG